MIVRLKFTIAAWISRACGMSLGLGPRLWLNSDFLQTIPAPTTEP